MYIGGYKIGIPQGVMPFVIGMRARGNALWAMDQAIIDLSSPIGWERRQWYLQVEGQISAQG